MLTKANAESKHLFFADLKYASEKSTFFDARGLHVDGTPSLIFPSLLSTRSDRLDMFAAASVCRGAKPKLQNCARLQPQCRAAHRLHEQKFGFLFVIRLRRGVRRDIGDYECRIFHVRQLDGFRIWRLGRRCRRRRCRRFCGSMREGAKQKRQQQLQPHRSNYLRFSLVQPQYNRRLEQPTTIFAVAYDARAPSLARLFARSLSRSLARSRFCSPPSQPANRCFLGYATCAASVKKRAYDRATC